MLAMQRLRLFATTRVTRYPVTSTCRSFHPRAPAYSLKNRSDSKTHTAPWRATYPSGVGGNQLRTQGRGVLRSYSSSADDKVGAQSEIHVEYCIK